MVSTAGRILPKCRAGEWRSPLPPMHELTALGLAGLCCIDVTAARAGRAEFRPGGGLGTAAREQLERASQRARLVGRGGLVPRRRALPRCAPVVSRSTRG